MSADFAKGNQPQFIEWKLNAVIEDACDKYYKIILFKMSNQPSGNNYMKSNEGKMYSSVYSRPDTAGKRDNVL